MWSDSHYKVAGTFQVPQPGKKYGIWRTAHGVCLLLWSQIERRWAGASERELYLMLIQEMSFDRRESS